MKIIYIYEGYINDEERSREFTVASEKYYKSTVAVETNLKKQEIERFEKDMKISGVSWIGLKESYYIDYIEEVNI